MKKRKEQNDGAILKFGFLVLLFLPVIFLLKILKLSLKLNDSNQAQELDPLEANDSTSNIEETKTFTNSDVQKIIGKGSVDDLTPRQKRIYNFIEKNKTIEMSKLQKKFRSVTVRTLRRDLKDISDKNLIVKIGNTKGVVYQLT